MNRKILLLRLILCKSGIQRAALLKKNHYFYEMGEHCYWQPTTVPFEGYLVKLHDNVTVTANVSFITHDIMEYGLNYKDSGYQQYIGSIEVGDNTFIGANATIMYNVKIGANVVIAAGSVVTKDVPAGSVVAGVPARVIGSTEKLREKRKSINISKQSGMKAMIAHFWGE